MAQSSTPQAETFTPKETNGSDKTHCLAGAAADAYKPGDSSYPAVFPGKASCDKLKSDDQLNKELSNFSSPYSSGVSTPDHAAGIKDIHRSVDAVNDASSHLSDAMNSARGGDMNGALQALRSTSGDLNKGGALLDGAQPNVGDLVKGDKDAQKSLSEAFYREGRSDSHIQAAEEKLRNGDFKGALNEMGTSSKDMTEEQKALHHNLAQMNHDDQTYDHPQGFKDIRAAITGGDSVTAGLNDAIHNARLGDTKGAIQSLHQSSGDLNTAGAHLDAGSGNVKDLMSTDKSARHHIGRGYEAEENANFHIDKAERMLREGDIDGALKAMDRGLTNVANEQANLRTGLKRLKNDYAPGYGDQQTSSQGNTAWDPYESLTLSTREYAPENAQK